MVRSASLDPGIGAAVAAGRPPHLPDQQPPFRALHAGVGGRRPRGRSPAAGLLRHARVPLARRPWHRVPPGPWRFDPGAACQRLRGRGPGRGETARGRGHGTAVRDAGVVASLALRRGLEGTVAMTAKRIIPCLDVDDGRVVKGVRFQNLRDAGDPAELAAFYDQEGADEVVFLDITASSDDRGILLDAVARTAAEVFIPLTVGGGVRSVDDMGELLTHGADKVSVNTAALADPNLITRCADMFGSQGVVLAIDARRRADGPGWEVFTHGGRRPTGRDAVEWAALGEKLGAGEALLTSMDGAGTATHMYDALTVGGAEAARAASIFHFGELSIGAVKKDLAARGLEIRR